VSKDGFSATWRILHMNRNYPQIWVGDQYKTDCSAFGLQLLQTADIYQKSTRLAKYAIMFLVFTFITFFFAEIISSHRLHPVQYLLVGAAILLFYTLVLSMSEHIHFNYAYIISAASITLLIAGYSKAIVPDSKFAFSVLGILTFLYSYLFIVLQLEDYSLIMGSLGLLVILAIVMFVTRKVRWYTNEIEKPQEDPGEANSAIRI
jgi:inner membrane protein